MDTNPIIVYHKSGLKHGQFTNTLTAWNNMREISGYNNYAYAFFDGRYFSYHPGRFTSFQDFINQGRSHNYG